MTSRRRQRICTWCSKIFTKDEHLARHIRTHTREKPFVCTTCEKSFSRHDSLLRHSRCHQWPGATPLTGAPHSLPSDVVNLPSSRHDQQISPTNHHYEFRRVYDALEPPRESVSAGLRYPSNSNIPRVSFECVNPVQRPTVISPNVEGVNEAQAEGGVPGLPTPGSEAQLVRLDACLRDSNQEEPLVFGNASTQIPAWFADDDFDLSALNSDVLMSTANWLPLGNSDQYQHESVGETSRPLEEDIAPAREVLVQRQWYTYMGTARAGHITPTTGPEQVEVDEVYRASLAVKLQSHSPFLPLPSTDFLNLCIQMYFTKFHPVFPIVHAPTFRPSSKSSLLLLSICSIGSLFVGSSHAASQGLKVFETLNKAILSSWERYFSRQGPETIAMVQAALLGQTFGLLSGRKNDLLIAQTFHGTLVVWAKRTDISHVEEASGCITLGEISNTPETAWRKWILAEEHNRLRAGVQVHDVEVSELFLTDPYLRHSPEKLPLLSSDDLWAATTVQDWSEHFLSESDTNGPQLRHPESGTNQTAQPNPAFVSTGFYIYLELQSLAASAIESRNTQSSAQRKCSEDALTTFHELRISPHRLNASDPYCLSVLWHSIFLSLYANIDRLELVIGRDGFNKAQENLLYARSWASSPDGQRCALHAALILRDLEEKKLNTGSPIHIPRIIFRAALVWYCYTRFGSDSTNSPQNVEFPELQKIGVNCQKLLFEANGFKLLRPTTSESGAFCGLVGILPRVGHWGIAQLFGSILNLLLPDVRDDERYLR